MMISPTRPVRRSYLQTTQRLATVNWYSAMQSHITSPSKTQDPELEQGATLTQPAIALLEQNVRMLQ